MSSKVKKQAIWNTQIVRGAILDSFRKLNPRLMMKNPVMFVVEIGSVITTVLLIRNAIAGSSGIGFALQITLWLWFTVLFANFAEAMAEGRGKAQAENLRKAGPRLRRDAFCRMELSRPLLLPSCAGTIS